MRTLKKFIMDFFGNIRFYPGGVVFFGGGGNGQDLQGFRESGIPSFKGLKM